MRCTQYYGLHDKAIEYLNKFSVHYTDYICRVFDGGAVDRLTVKGSESLVKSEPYANVGMFGEQSLYKYTLPDGTVLYEVVQKEEWSSGPMIWTTLSTKDTPYIDDIGSVIVGVSWHDEEMTD